MKPIDKVHVHPGYDWVAVDVLGVSVSPDRLEELSLEHRLPRPVWPPQALRWALYGARI